MKKISSLKSFEAIKKETLTWEVKILTQKLLILERSFLATAVSFFEMGNLTLQLL
jgi:hypothetical protein